MSSSHTLDRYLDALTTDRPGAVLVDPARRRFNITCPSGPDTTDPHDIDWATRQALALVGFELDENGLGLNPTVPDPAALAPGQGGLWHWGPACAADAVVLAIVDGIRYLLMVERDDDGGWALPGGMLDAGEAPLIAAARELEEETGLILAPHELAMLPGRGVPDPRAGRHAWMETVPALAVLDLEHLPVVEGRDDARRAEWVPATSWPALLARLVARGRTLYPAHVDLLREVLNCQVLGSATS